MSGVCGPEFPKIAGIWDSYSLAVFVIGELVDLLSGEQGCLLLAFCMS
jgi:hypothetical protein